MGIMHQASLGRSKRFDSRAGLEVPTDTHSVMSGVSKTSKFYVKEVKDRKITLRDIQLIMPTVLILLFTVLIMVTVIPYAFSSVLKQLEAVRSLEAAGEMSRTLKEMMEEPVRTSRSPLSSDKTLKSSLS